MHVRWNIPSWAASLSIRFVVCSWSCVRQAVAFNKIQDNKTARYPLKDTVLVSPASVVSDALNPPKYTDSFIDIVSARNKGGAKGKVGTLSRDVWQKQKAWLFKWLINAAYNNLWSRLYHLSRVDLVAVSVEIYWTKARWLISYQRLSLYKGGSLGWSSFSPYA